MNFTPLQPPRIFSVGQHGQIQIRDCGQAHLEPDEQVTFVTSSGRQYDFAAKSWGFYATPSVNGRLRHQGFKTALVRNEAGLWYVMVVERDRVDDFLEYLAQERQVLGEWLDERN